MGQSHVYRNQLLFNEHPPGSLPKLSTTSRPVYRYRPLYHDFYTIYTIWKYLEALYMITENMESQLTHKLWLEDGYCKKMD
jgi:hypothetical protein